MSAAIEHSNMFSQTKSKAFKMNIQKIEGDTPTRLQCKVCHNLLRNAVNLACCQQLVCRGCAVKNIIKNKSHCFLPSCLKPSSITDLKGNENVRKECQQICDSKIKSDEKQSELSAKIKQQKKLPGQNEKEHNLRKLNYIIEHTESSGNQSFFFS